MDQNEIEENKKAVELWKMKKLIQSLESARGNGTSMISLIIPPGDQICRITKMLTTELGTASNIKSRVNRLSVLGAITSAQTRLKNYNSVPKKGLVLYCGTILTNDNKEKKVSIDFEPFKPINTSLYRCDDVFHVEALYELMDNDQKYGFIIVDGKGSLYGTLTGNTKNILKEFSVDLPKKHGMGGQSAQRFGRIRMEKRHNYIRKVSEMATNLFITNDKPNIVSLVLAGNAEFKDILYDSNLFDPRLCSIVLKTVDVSYGGENGFNQAIQFVQEDLGNIKFVKEKKILTQYFTEISQDTGKFCFGHQDTLTALESGSIETLIVWESLDLHRYVLVNKITNNKTIKIDKENKIFQEDNIEEVLPLSEWLAQNYTTFGAKLEFVSNKTSEGDQFCKGFSGLGGLLRFKVDFQEMDESLYEKEMDEDDFF